ncbi:MAG: Hpt domain-containing protein [Dehalococcoidia bacterium]
MNQASYIGPEERIIVQVEAYLESILPDFLARRRGDIESLRQALEQGDFESLRVFGHRMKGTGGAYGLDAVSDLGRTLEQAAQEENCAAMQGLLNLFEEYFDRVEVVYQ